MEKNTAFLIAGELKFVNSRYHFIFGAIAAAIALSFPLKLRAEEGQFVPVQKNLAGDRTKKMPVATTENSSFPDLQFVQNDAEDWPEPINDSITHWLFLIEQLEYRNNEGSDSLNWEATGWIGGDYERFWLETEGEVGLVSEEGTEAEVQLLYGKLVAPFWDLQAGLRYDRTFSTEDDIGRGFGVIGLQGLAPYQFEIDASFFVSEDADISARVSAETHFLLTQRLVLQPEVEVNLAVQEVEEWGVGSGLNDVELSMRLRYEFSREFAPYLGISWSQKLGETADFAREEGEEASNLAILGGVRLMF